MLLAKELLQSLLAHVDARPASHTLTQLNLTHDALRRAMDEVDATEAHPDPPAPAQSPAFEARIDAITASLATLQTENQELRELIRPSTLVLCSGGQVWNAQPGSEGTLQNRLGHGEDGRSHSTVGRASGSQL
jgi:hypothetical protein